MTLIYATGLRLSEALNLKLTGIDSDRMQPRVKHPLAEMSIRYDPQTA